MDQKNQPKQPDTKTAETAEKAKIRRPNDVGSLQIDGFVKIFDPNTREIFVEKRA